jgi:hypothetical protein
MKKAFLYGLLIFITSVLRSQDVEVKTDYPSVVSVGQQFSVTYSVNTGGGEFVVPSFDGLTKLMGPQTSYSQSTQIINGKISRQTSYSYIYYLQADKEGTFIIPPAVFTYKNKEYKSEQMRIEVVAGSPSTSSRSSSSSRGSASDNISETIPEGELFVNVYLNRKEVYLGEPILATVKLFTQVDLQGINEIKYPSFNDFLRTDLETEPLTSLEQERINGKVYGTGIIQRFLLYPQVAGNITIDPVQLNVLVHQRTSDPDPFFGDFFSSYQTIPKAISSKPVTIRVKPLPGVRPEKFSGVVGKLDISAKIDKDSIKVNDAVNLKITVSGSGNLKIASAPELKLEPGIEVYDPKVTENLQNSGNGTTGSKTFEYLLIPRHNGEFTIPSVTYSYFDTGTGKYETLHTQEFKFFAEKTNDQSGGGVTLYSGVTKEDVKYLGKDIRFIKSEPGTFLRKGNVITSRQSFYLSYAVAFAAFFMVIFVRREHIRRNADMSLVKNRKAGRIAGKRLHAASECLKNNQIDKFYEETLKAIWGYLSDKLSIPVSSLTRSNAETALRSRGVDDEKIIHLNNILDTCEYARFAPSASNSEAGKIYDEASQFIKSVENSIR